MAPDSARAVASPVGIVLMVAVTVVVASVLSVFALSFGEVVEPPPEGAFEFEYAQDGDTADGIPSDELTLVYTHGDKVPGDRINVTVAGAKEVDPNGNVVGGNLAFEPSYAGGGKLFGSDTVAAGETDTITDADFTSPRGNNVLGNQRKLDLSGATVRVYWVSETGDNSAILAEWTGPDANDG